MPVIHWFRRDLRLTDNTALNAAALASEGEVIPAFVLDDRLLAGRHVAPARVQFMLDSLRELDGDLRRLGSRLIVRRGNSADVLPQLAQETKANATYFNRDYTPAARARDERVVTALRADGYATQSFKDQVIYEGRELLTGLGKPYTVYSPYKRAWLANAPKRERLAESGAGAPPALKPIDEAVASLTLPDAKALGFSVTQTLPPAGEREARARLDAFLAHKAADYDTRRNVLADDGTSRLSPYLRFGALSPRQCLAAALAAMAEAAPAKHLGFETWISELIWRDFYQQILLHFPHAKTGNFNTAYDALRTGSDDAALDEARFAAWREGRTGYPVVDAAMRQLNETAWMHNRARMIVASFLTKDLLLDWRLGEHYFSDKLVDGDPAANNGGWQWAASTGTDAQPYFRVFNPRLQSERFDPDGAYIKRWVPELARVPVEHIHDPSAMPPLVQRQAGCVIGQDYPAPIVNHAEQKDEILRRFKAIK